MINYYYSYNRIVLLIIIVDYYSCNIMIIINIVGFSYNMIIIIVDHYSYNNHHYH